MINCARVLRASPGNSLPLTETAYSSGRVKLCTCKCKVTLGDSARCRAAHRGWPQRSGHHRYALVQTFMPEGMDP